MFGVQQNKQGSTGHNTRVIKKIMTRFSLVNYSFKYRCLGSFSLTASRISHMFFKVISSQWDGVLGRATIIVSSEPVTPGDLSVQLVGGLGLSINSSPSHPSIITATVNAHNTLYNHGQVSKQSINILTLLFWQICSSPHSLHSFLLGSIHQCLDPV